MWVDVRPGDVVSLRKSHPCGTNEWTVTRIGADIGLKCHGCGRHIMLTRGLFNRRVKKFISRVQRAGGIVPSDD
ncbi:MAG TPA: DUF951 domain-containing protein [Anaerolineae bacterium]|nr:DUF951 domain-containing protein [Anaerolineae bacterium]